MLAPSRFVSLTLNLLFYFLRHANAIYRCLPENVDGLVRPSFPKDRTIQLSSLHKTYRPGSNGLSSPGAPRPLDPIRPINLEIKRNLLTIHKP